MRNHLFVTVLLREGAEPKRSSLNGWRDDWRSRYSLSSVVKADSDPPRNAGSDAVSEVP
jgi:hypothetical protein